MKKTTLKKKTSRRPAKVLTTRKRVRIPSWREVGEAFAWPFVTLYNALRRKRREAPHKSFVWTRRRDKVKTPKMEGYIAFPWYVLRILWNRKWVYVRLVALFFLLSIIFVGAIQIDNITSVNEVIDSASSDGNILGPVTRAAITVGSSIGGALNGNLSDVQYIYISALYILVLLTAVWLVRHQLAGSKVKMRDGLYGAAAPIAAEYALIVIGILQLIPAALATLIFVSAQALGLFNGGIETAMFSVALFLVIVLTLYFMTTTLFAMFIVTIPGTYPIKAYRAARRIVAGQRLRLLLRLFWLVVVLLLTWFVVFVPIIIIVNSFGGGNSMAIPVAYQLMIIASIVYATAYSYLLYRRMIDEPVEEK